MAIVLVVPAAAPDELCGEAVEEACCCDREADGFADGQVEDDDDDGGDDGCFVANLKDDCGRKAASKLARKGLLFDMVGFEGSEADDLLID